MTELKVILSGLDSPDILIVDDTPDNLRVLSAMLKKSGFRARPAPNGEVALRAARAEPPDLVLLDVNMPDLDGFEVCRRMKADDALHDVPVIFLSALTDPADKVRGFEAGAVDFISKPFQFEEVHARIRTHLDLRSLQRQLHEQNLHLEEMVADRTRELAVAYEKLRGVDRLKDDFLGMISHEMRTPANGILAVAELALAPDTSAEERSELEEIYRLSRERMEALLDDAATLRALETPASEVSCPGSLAEAVSPLPLRGTDFPAGCRLTPLRGDPALLRRAATTVARLVEAFTPGRCDFRIHCEPAGGAIELRFRLTPFGLSEEHCSRYFDLTASVRAHSPAEALGLAPVVARRILAAFGGDLRLERAGAGEGVLTMVLAICPFWKPDAAEAEQPSASREGTARQA